MTKNIRRVTAGFSAVALMLGGVLLSPLGAHAEEPCEVKDGAISVSGSTLCMMTETFDTINFDGTIEEFHAMAHAFSMNSGFGYQTYSGENGATINAHISTAVSDQNLRDIAAALAQAAGENVIKADVVVSPANDYVVTDVHSTLPAGYTVNYDDIVVHLPAETTLADAFAVYKNASSKTVQVAINGQDYPVISYDAAESRQVDVVHLDPETSIDDALNAIAELGSEGTYALASGMNYWIKVVEGTPEIYVLDSSYLADALEAEGVATVYAHLDLEVDTLVVPLSKTLVELDSTVAVKDLENSRIEGKFIAKDGEEYKILKVSSSTNGGIADGTRLVKVGETVTPTVKADAGYELDKILLDGEPVEGESFVMPGKNAAVWATFKKTGSLLFSSDWTKNSDGTYARKVYVPYSATLTWGELGVDAGEYPMNIVVSAEGGAKVDSGAKTVFMNNTDDATSVTWSFGDVKGTLTLVGFMAPFSNSNSLVQAGSEASFYWDELPEGLEFTSADENIAKVVRVASTHVTEDGQEFISRYYVVRGVKTGTTKIGLKAADGTFVGERAGMTADVYDVATTLKNVQTVGADQTFTVTPSAGYEIQSVTVHYSDDANKEDSEVVAPAKIVKNDDGSYTLVADRMPAYSYEDVETGETITEKSPTLMVMVTLKKDGAFAYARYFVTLAENAEQAEEYEKVDNLATTIAKAILDDTAEITLKGDAAKIALSDGTVVELSQKAASFIEAVQNGADITTRLDSYEITGEFLEYYEEQNEAVVSALKAELSEKAEGERLFDISIEVMLGGEYYGNLTELSEPVKIALDVSSDLETPVAEGYKRVYTVVRYHDGVVEVLADEDVAYDEATGTLYVTTDKFSTYLVAYEDVLTATADTGAFTSEGGSATTNAALIATVVALAVMAASAKILVKARK